MHDVRLPHHDQPNRSDEVDDVAASEDQSRNIARKQQLHARDRPRQVEIDGAFFLHPGDEVRGGEDREKCAEEVEDNREAGLESEDQTFDADAVIGRHLHFFSEERGAGQCTVDDVEIDRRRENDDENS